MTVTFTIFFGTGTPPTAPHGTAPLWVIVLLWIVMPLLFCAVIWKVHRDNVRKTKSGHDGGDQIAFEDSGSSDVTHDHHESTHQEGGDSGHMDYGLHQQPA